MIVLDTNVLSEPLRAEPSPAVLQWLAAITDDVALTSISVGEILAGVRALPDGRRRDSLLSAIEQSFAAFPDRVLAYDEAAARVYASIRDDRRRSGHALSVEDGMIAVICRATGSTLATRNVKDFDDLGLTVINPWLV